ncbi:hypothetical protein ACFU6J_27310, partial [Streptomyces gardneri]
SGAGADVFRTAAPESDAPSRTVRAGHGRTRAGEDGSVAYAAGEDLFGRPLPPLSPAVDLEGVDVAASSAVTMPWRERTAAVLQMHYPGQEGAAAARHGWLLGTGRRTVRVGSSSADPGLSLGVEVGPS